MGMQPTKNEFVSCWKREDLKSSVSQTIASHCEQQVSKMTDSPGAGWWPNKELHKHRWNQLM